MFRLKYVFPDAKIIKTDRYVIMKLSEDYLYKVVYHSMCASKNHQSNNFCKVLKGLQEAEHL